MKSEDSGSIVSRGSMSLLLQQLLRRDRSFNQVSIPTSPTDSKRFLHYIRFALLATIQP
jgi:hypothetical protein